MNCIICSKKADRAHIKTRGSGGSDDAWNLMSLCRMHHTEQHASGWFKFANKYPIVMKELEFQGWRFEDNFGMWKLRRSIS